MDKEASAKTPEFERFEKAVKEIVTTPKKVVDDKIKAKKEANKRRGRS